MKISNFQTLNFKAMQNGAGAKEKRYINKIASEQINEIETKKKCLFEAMNAYNSKEIKEKINSLPSGDMVSFYSIKRGYPGVKDDIDYPAISYYPDEENTPWEVEEEIMRIQDLELKGVTDYKKAIAEWLDKISTIITAGNK